MAKTKKRGKLLWAVLILAIIVTGFLIYEQISTAMNKRDFQNARTAIDSIYANVVRRVGQPDNARVDSQCKKAHEEFSSGSLSCNTGNDFIYSVQDFNQATLLMKEIQSTINTSSLKPKKTLSTNIHESSVGNNLYHTASDTYKFRSLDCVATYVYDTPEATSLSIKNKNKKPLEVSIGCFGPAKKQYYKLAS